MASNETREQMQIEIFDRSTREVVETVDVADMASFRTYWNSQCDSVAFGFRVKDSNAPAYRHFVRREPNEHGHSAPETLDLTDEVVAQIAKGNEYMTPEQVRIALMQGKTIYTSFSKYTLES
jgi:hypothetical protein